jgi:hypothetical protein
MIFGFERPCRDDQMSSIAKSHVTPAAVPKAVTKTGKLIACYPFRPQPLILLPAFRV